MVATKKKSSSKKPAVQRSFVSSANNVPFFTFRLTYQTIYWLIISVLLLGLGIWVTSLSVKVETIYDQIEANNSTVTPITHVVKPLEKKK